MDSLRKLVVRDDSTSSTDSLNPTMVNLLIALLVLIFFGFCLVGALYLIRRRRQARKTSLLPTHNGKTNKSNHRRLTITATPYSGRPDSVHVYSEKRDLMDNSASPPPSPVPEIRITFPDEEDHSGRRKSGKVVVVRISDCGSVGMEPCAEEENLPPYQRSDAERFQSLDLERMGGLKEKDDMKMWS